MLPALATIWLLHLAATMTPGANTVLITQLAAGGTRGSAARAVAGITAGSVVWATLALSGVGALLQAFPGVRAAMLAVGGFYLVWLGARLCLSAACGAMPRSGVDRPDRAFRIGLLTNLTNPKALLFFGSLFTAGLPADPPGWLPLMAILIVFLNALCWYGLLAYLFSRSTVRDWYAAHAHRLSAASGIVLGAAGLQLLNRACAEMRA